VLHLTLLASAARRPRRGLDPPGAWPTPEERRHDARIPLAPKPAFEALLKITVPVLELLGLPSLQDVTDDQSRGVDCVWCRARVTTDTAVDLGEQKSPLNGSAL
jgi:hypothetical protein